MEQYFTRSEMNLQTLRFCLDNYVADELFIRLVGSKGGGIKVNEKIGKGKLDFKKDDAGLYFLIGSKEVFHFPWKDVGTRAGIGFSIAFERSYPGGREVALGTGIDPYDPKLPGPKRSALVECVDDHLLKIFFKGRIDLKFHSWYQEPYWRYWEVIAKKRT